MAPMICTLTINGRSVTAICLDGDFRRKRGIMHAEIRALNLWIARYGRIRSSWKIVFRIENTKGFTSCSKPCTLCVVQLRKRVPNAICVYTDVEGNVVRRKVSEIRDTKHSSCNRNYDNFVPLVRPKVAKVPAVKFGVRSVEGKSIWTEI